MDALLAYNGVVDECFKFSINMLLNSTIMLVIVLYYAIVYMLPYYYYAQNYAGIICQGLLPIVHVFLITCIFTVTVFPNTLALYTDHLEGNKHSLAYFVSWQHCGDYSTCRKDYVTVNIYPHTFSFELVYSTS